MTLSDESDDVIFTSEFDIPTPEGRSDRRLMHFQDVARVPDGELVSAEVQIDGETYENEQEVTCSAGMATNTFRLVIYASPQRSPGMKLQTLSAGEKFAGSPC